MQEFNLESLIKNLLKNKLIAKRVKELNLTKGQIIEALPIMIDMSEQDENTKDLYLTSFYLTDSGQVKRMEVLSKYGQNFEYLNYIVTQKIYPIEFDLDKTLVLKSSRIEIVKVIKKFFEDLKPNNLGFYLYGDYGTGKTFILKRIAKKIAQNKFTVGYVSLPELVNYLKISFGQTDQYENVKNLLKNVDFLFFDNIGQETITSWFRDDFLTQVLIYRKDKNKTTFFGSNYDVENLLKIEARTLNYRFLENEKAKRLINQIKSLTISIKL